MSSSVEPGTVAVVAAFDVDGTLVRGDSLLPFLRRTVGMPRTLCGLVAAAVTLLRNPRRPDRSVAKAALLATVFRGCSDARLRAGGREFAFRLVARRLHHDAARALLAHQLAGHLTVLVSASPDVYVEALGSLLEVDGVLCTRLQVGPDGRLTGQIAGANVRGDEKVVQLRRWLGAVPLDLERTTVYVYGDGRGDDALFAAFSANARDRRVQRVFPAERFAPAP